MALSFGVGDYVEGGVLAAVIGLNVSIGFFQEYGAEKKMDALRALSSPSAHVIRDGRAVVISKYVSSTSSYNLYWTTAKNTSSVPRSFQATSASSKWATQSRPICASSRP